MRTTGAAGLLGQGSILTVTSHATRTSPVLRGKWVLDNLLGAPPPPPPADVPALPEKGEGNEPASVRARLEQHRNNPVCASCHSRMDPLGFALENFDGIGKWRVRDQDGAPIDAAAALPDGIAFEGPSALRTLLDSRREQFAATVAAKLLTYALGRGVEYYDQAGVARGRSRRGGKRLPLVVGDSRHRRERAVSNEESRTMIVTRKAIPRRTMLRGLGATVALPFLDAMVPAFGRLAAAAPKTSRLSTIYIGNGANMKTWTPAAEGRAYEMTPMLEPLAAFRDRMLVISGLDNKPGLALPGEPAGGHGRIGGSFLTGVHVKPTEGADFEAGISIDQIAARELGQKTQLASLELSLDTTEFAGACDAGFSCAYTTTLCWRGPTAPVPMEHDPRAVFERLFGDSGSTDRAERLSRLDGQSQHPGFGDRQAGATAARSGRARPGEADAVRRCDSRRRAPYSACRGTERARAAGRGAAGRRARQLRGVRTSSCSICRCSRCSPI